MKRFVKQLKNIDIFKFKISKRQSFVLILIPLCVGLLITQLIDIELRYLSVIILSLVVYFVSAWVLREDLSGVEWITLLILPSIYTMAIGLFYFLVPGRWATRIVSISIYAIGMYALLITENIYNVAANRSIGLLRAAYSVGFLMTLITLFLLFDVVYSFKMSSLANGVVVLVITFPLFLSSYWSIELSENISKKVILYALISCFCLSQLALAISFWPIAPTVSALFLTTASYEILGLSQYFLIQKLINKVYLEFVLVGILVFFATYFVASWGGI